MSHECLLAYPNRADVCELSGGSWEAGLPLANLQTQLYRQVARTTNDANASTKFYFELDRQRGVRVIGLDYHNISVDGQYRIRLYTDVYMGTLVYDSGTLDVFEIIYTEDTLDWDDGSFFDGRISIEDRAELRTLLVHVCPSTQFVGFGLFEIFDDANPDGYVEAGRLFLATAFVPGTNMDAGASIDYEDRDQIEEADGGAEYANARPPCRVARFTLNLLSESEGMRVLDMKRQLGSSGEVLYMWDRNDTLHQLRRSFIGRLRQLSPIEAIEYDTDSAVFEIKEKL